MNHVSEKLKEVTLTIQSLQDCYDKVQNSSKKEEIYNIIYQLQQLKSSVEINKNYLPGVNVSPVKDDVNVKPVKIPTQPSLQLPLGTTAAKLDQKTSYLPTSQFTPAATQEVSQKLKLEADANGKAVWEKYRELAEGINFKDKNAVAQWVIGIINPDDGVRNELKPLVAQSITQRIIAMKHLNH